MILVGHALDHLRAMPAESVNCVVTSPPYWGLRDYGCEGQLGLEKTPKEYIANMVEIFREIKRVLRKGGTIWVNMGDSYHQGNKGNSGEFKVSCKQATNVGSHSTRRGNIGPTRKTNLEGLPPKSLCGMPWRLALALQDDGWILRSDIIWSKPNPMPSSVKDRCAVSHEYIFMLSKSKRYWSDFEAISEPCSPSTHARLAQDVENQIGSARANGGAKTNGNMKAVGKITPAGSGIRNNESFVNSVCLRVDSRNCRTVWTIATQPYKEAHFATFPEEIPRRCILAGCPEGGVVLDTFGGSGTTGAVALALGRDYILIELNPDYAELARKRIASVTPGMRFAEGE